eukprot:CAMPEP_0172457062 /NCGR_PEP_ID=MMETSP1065-20121228/19760_1 /TAXON_ID=265537 /ORGANISM="Amphiprora paludosa, Strain CCMP125" /LENGTH=267 /DNA_ID=CAMNT_0013210543 /DNA_START=86 /DNA_END=889 /DNA_ORIENTATION=+
MASSNNDPLCVEELQAMNTLAISEHVEYGEYQDAAVIFSTMVSQLSTCRLAPTPLGHLEADVRLNRLHVYCDPDDDDSMEDSGVNVSLDPKVNDLFARPFAFEYKSTSVSTKTPEEEEPLITSEEYNLLAVTALFNLGLCFSLEWKRVMMNHKKTEEEEGAPRRSTGCSDALLQHALYYYEQAFSLSSVSHQLTPDDPLLPLLMAVCVNATHCQVELAMCTGATNVWNDRLRMLLQFSSGHGEESTRQFFSMAAFFQSFPRIAAGMA